MCARIPRHGQRRTHESAKHPRQTRQSPNLWLGRLSWCQILLRQPPPSPILTKKNKSTRRKCCETAVRQITSITVHAQGPLSTDWSLPTPTHASFLNSVMYMPHNKMRLPESYTSIGALFCLEQKFLIKPHLLRHRHVKEPVR